jgi:nitroreductase
MNDILDLIKSRRTIKNFLPKYVSWEKLSLIIDAGRHAPSSGNIQNWRFVVVNNDDLKHQIAEACYEQYDIVKATLIVVCSEPEKVARYYGLRGERLYSVQNCAVAIENMILEAQSLGLGTRWIGAFEEEELKSLLKIPIQVRPQAILAVGHYDDNPEKPPKYPLEMVTYFNQWKGRLTDPAKYMNETATIMARKFKAVSEGIKETSEKIKDKTKDLISKK